MGPKDNAKFQYTEINPTNVKEPNSIYVDFDQVCTQHSSEMDSYCTSTAKFDNKISQRIS